MNKRGIVLFLALALLLPLTAFAELMQAEVVDGNTHVGIFKLAAEPEEYQTWWTDMQKSSRNVVLAGPQGVFYYFLVIPEGATVTITDASVAGNQLISFRCSKPVEFIKFLDVPSGDGYSLEVDVKGVLSGGTAVPGMSQVVTGSYFNTVGYSFPSLSYDYITEYTGVLHIEDDLGGEPGGDTGLLAWLSKLWEWLTSFWDTLKNLIIGLFVPEDGYFQGFVNTLRTAFDSKLGGLGTVVDSIKNGFAALGAGTYSNSLVITIPDNTYFYGATGTSVDLLEPFRPYLPKFRGLLNGILVIITIVLCQRRLTAIIKGDGT